MEPIAKRQKVLTPKNTSIPRPEQEALASIRAGLSPATHAQRRGIKEGSAWSYYTRVAFHHLDAGELMDALPLVDKALVELLIALRKDDPELFKGALMPDLVNHVDEVLPKDGKYHTNSDHRISHLRLARTIVEKQ